MSCEESNKSIFIIAPKECSSELLATFFDSVLKGGQINTTQELLKENINNCHLLAFCHIDGDIAGISAVKIPRINYKKSVFEKAKATSEANVFNFEIGYVVTLQGYQGQKISSILITKLIAHNKLSKYFATTKSDVMRKIFKNIGFVKFGDSYLNFAKEKLDLYVYQNEK